MKSTVATALLIIIPFIIKAQKHCIQFPGKKLDIIANPSFEIASGNCLSNYVFNSSRMVILNWYSLHQIVPVAYVTRCFNFALWDSLLVSDNEAAKSIFPNRLATEAFLTFPPVMPQPLPDGNAALLITDKARPPGQTGDSTDAKGYAATCLLQPLQKDSLYRLDFSVGFGQQAQGSITYSDTTATVIIGTGDTLFPRAYSQNYPKANNGISSPQETITIYGKSNCDNFTKYANYRSCLKNQEWIELGSVTIQSELNTWVKTSIAFVAPQNISAFAIGPGCQKMVRTADTAYFFQYFIDNLQLYTPVIEQPSLTQVAGSMCNHDVTLQLNPAGVYKPADLQWFKNDLPVTGANSQTLQITDANNGQGYYQCRVQNDTVCLYSDSMGVFWQARPSAALLDNGDANVCFSDSITLNANAGFGATYLWQNGSTSPTFTVNAPGSYSVTITNACGPTTINKKVNFIPCSDSLFIPTAFTPNGDGRNDIFRPFYYYVAGRYNMAIYNRFGEKLFVSGNIANGWDGTYKGRQQAPGAYVYVIQYQRRTGKAYFARGTVVLMR